DCGKPFDVRELVVGFRPVGGLPHIGKRAGGQRLAQAPKASAEPRVQGDDAIADHHAKALLSVCKVACQFHWMPPKEFTSSCRDRPDARRAPGVPADSPPR